MTKTKKGQTTMKDMEELNMAAEEHYQVLFVNCYNPKSQNISNLLSPRKSIQ